MTTIDSLHELRALYPPPAQRAVLKQLPALDAHCRRFIDLSPFLVLATGGEGAAMDASPRGGAPGFVKVTDQGALLIPDAAGNRRLDTLENIIHTGRAGVLFMVPGVDETLRVNGVARLSRADEHLALCTTERRVPVLVIHLQVQEAYLHCAKALLRSRLWAPGSQVARSALPTAGQILMDHTGIPTAPETQQEMERRYAPDL